MERLPDVGAGADPYWRLVTAFVVGYPPHSSRAYFSDLRAWYAWYATAGLHPLTARRHHVEVSVRNRSEQLQPATGRSASIARRLSCLGGAIQIIDLDGRPAALAAGGTAIIANHVAPALLAHVQAKALYALQIQAGERPGPYTDSDARPARRAQRRGDDRDTGVAPSTGERTPSAPALTPPAAPARRADSLVELLAVSASAAATSSRAVRLNAAMTDRADTQAWLLRHSDRLLLTLIALALGVAGATGQATDIAIGSVNATSTPADVAVDFVANAMIAVICLPLAALGAREPLRDRPRRRSDIH